MTRANARSDASLEQKGRDVRGVNVGRRTHGIRATYVDGCGCADCKRADAEYQRGRRRRNYALTDPVVRDEQEPTNLTAEQWAETAPGTWALLVREFGRDAAVRILNGAPARVPPTPAPADPATVAPPGTRVVSHLHGGNRHTAGKHLIGEWT